jgi:hypothetical protein
MFTLLSGRLVRDDADVERLLREAGHAKIPSLRVVMPQLPEQLAGLVDLALLVDAGGRWSSAKAMLGAVRLVHAQLESPGAFQGPAGGDDDDEAVSAPSFGFIPTRSIDPPPVSRVAAVEELPQISRLPPPPPDLAIVARLETPEEGLRSTSMGEPPARGRQLPTGSFTIPAPKIARRRVPAWLVTMVIAALATGAVMAALWR